MKAGESEGRCHLQLSAECEDIELEAGLGYMSQKGRERERGGEEGKEKKEKKRGKEKV